MNKKITTILSIITIIVGTMGITSSKAKALIAVPPPVESNCSKFTQNLKIGDGLRNYKSNQVLELQSTLQADGYFGNASATGYFGLVTYSSVIKYQRANSISATGFVGPVTRASLQAKYCQPQMICDYAAPPMNCSYVPGPQYNSTTQCGMVLSCSPQYLNETQARAIAQNTCTQNGKTVSNSGGSYNDNTKSWIFKLDNIPQNDCNQICVVNETTKTAEINYFCTGLVREPVACTMEARSCNNGTAMPRDANCTWHPEMCSQ